MTDDEDAPARRAAVRWSAALARRLCARVAAGEVLYALCREEGMPTAQSVRMWARARPGFAAALEAARAEGGRASRGGGVWTYCAPVAEAVFERMCQGESLTAISRDPVMPSLSTLYHWRRTFPEFAELLRSAREIQAERFCDLGWELACSATPETAYLTHVRLTHLRWTAGVMAPRAFRLKAVEPPGEAGGEAPVLDVLIRRFEIEDDPVTGVQKVVAYRPNPRTGEVEREG